MSLVTNKINHDISEMNALYTRELNVLNTVKVNALSLLWVLFHTSCISNLILPSK